MSTETYIGIIPARYKSSRFPGKPLCDILGKPMIWHVYNSVMKWDKWKKVYVATDSLKIKEKCDEMNIPCLMTSDQHVDCLDRAYEVVSNLQGKQEGADKYIIIQGDEPLFNVDTLNVPLGNSIINFYTKVQDPSEMYDSNAVKVVVSEHGRAIYFSRYSIPYHEEKTKRSNESVSILKQIGVYVFSGDGLRQYSQLAPSSLEKMEGIGLNRLIENDISVYMRYTSHDSISVDTPEDRNRIIKIMKKRHQEQGTNVDDSGNISDQEEKRFP